MTKKVALFIRSLSKGGAEKQSVLLSEYLAKHYSTFLIVYAKSNRSISLINPMFQIIYLEGNIFQKILQLFSVFKKNNISHLFNYLPLNNILGITIGKFAGVRNIYGGIRGARHKNRTKMMLMKFLCNKIATGFISNSYAAAESYSSYGFNSEKIWVIHNAIEKNNNIINFQKNDKFRILSIGRFTSDKDYPTAIKAIKYLVTKHPALKNKLIYKIIGYGVLEQDIRRIIAEHNVKSYIQLKADGEIGDNFKNADVLLITSTYEGMPNVVMEAMNNKLPIIATAAGDSGHLVRNNKNGFLCSVKDYKSIAQYLFVLITNEKKKLEMGEESLKIIEQNFRPEKVFCPYISLIENGK